ELVARVDHQARRGDRRHPVAPGLLYPRTRGRRVNRLPLRRVVDAVAVDRPAVVGALLDQVELVAALRAVLTLPDVAVGIDREALRAAVPVAPDLRPGVRTPHEGVVVG